jgi:hypothetical protein
VLFFVTTGEGRGNNPATDVVLAGSGARVLAATGGGGGGGEGGLTEWVALTAVSVAAVEVKVE